MITFIVIIVIAALSLWLLWFFSGKTKGVFIFGSMGLLIGLMGYIIQGQPDLPSKNTQIATEKPTNTLQSDMPDVAQGVGNSDIRLRQAKAFMNASRPDLALQVIQNGLKNRPNDAQLWTGMGNILMAQGKGILAPPAEYAFMQAIRNAPDYPIARFYYGASLIGADRLDEGRKQWLSLLDMMPKNGTERDALVSIMAESGALEPDEVAAFKNGK
jgi:cytochrome c-type biogenesis protein CcmH